MPRNLSEKVIASARKTLRVLLPVAMICVTVPFLGERAVCEETDRDHAANYSNTPEDPDARDSAESGSASLEENAQESPQSDYLKQNLYKNVKKTRPEPKAPQEIASRQTPTPGVFSIRKMGDGYNIDVQMDMRDFNDENMYFQMDLPNENADKNNSEKNPDQIKDEQTQPERGSVEATNKADQAKDEGSVINISNKHMLYAQSYLAEGKTDRALFEVDQSLKAAPKSALALALKGSIFYKRGEIDLARAYWKKAYRLDPTIDNLKDSLNRVGGE